MAKGFGSIIYPFVKSYFKNINNGNLKIFGKISLGFLLFWVIVIVLVFIVNFGFIIYGSMPFPR
jgi:hypothetical protein